MTTFLTIIAVLLFLGMLAKFYFLPLLATVSFTIWCVSQPGIDLNFFGYAFFTIINLVAIYWVGLFAPDEDNGKR